MYKYQCSKLDCGSTWTLNEGKLNGFVLTCPLCGKGRGMFVAQSKREINDFSKEGVDTMVIAVSSDTTKSTQQMEEQIERFVKKHGLIEIAKEIQSRGTEYICTLHYKIGNE